MIAPPRPLFSWWDMDGVLESSSVILLVLDSDGSIGTISSLADGHEYVPDRDISNFIGVTEEGADIEWVQKDFEKRRKSE